jgi:hypothetical protein
VFSSTLFPREGAVFLVAAVVFGVLCASEIPRFPDTLVALLLTLELIWVLRLLPFGYLALAVLATSWWVAMTSLWRRYLAGMLDARSARQELLAALLVSIAIALVSSIWPR